MGWPCFFLRLRTSACYLLLAGAFLLSSGPVHTQQGASGSLPGELSAGEVLVEARVESTSIPLNRVLTLKVTATCLGDMDRYEFRWPGPPELDNFGIVGNAEANVVADDSGQIRTSREFTYLLKPAGEGTGRIGPVSLFYLDRLTGKEHSLSTRTISVDVTGPVSEGAGGGRLVLRMSLILLAAVGAFLFLFLRRKRRPAPAGSLSPERIQSPAELALEELEAVPGLRLEGEIKQSYSTISGAFRHYIDRTFAFRTAELTTRDIIDHLRTEDIAEDHVQKLEVILSTCDVVKYAPHEPSPADLERLLSQAREYFSGMKETSDTGEEEKPGPEA